MAFVKYSPAAATVDPTLVELQDGGVVSLSTDNATGDAFGRLRTSGTGNRLDIEFIYDKQPLLVDEVTAGSATATHDANARDVLLDIVAATASDSAALYSHYDVPYTPGNSQLAELTGTLDGTDLGTGSAYLFVRSTVSGSTVETRYDQSDWTNTVADQSWSDSFILAMDFQSLKVGRIRFAMNRSGVPTHLLEVVNDNVRATGYWQTPTLPVYWRIYNDATYTYAEMGYGDTSNAIGICYRMPVNADATMRAICATVKSEGGLGLLDIPGYPLSASNSTTAVTVSSTKVPVLSIRPAANLNSITNRGLYLPTAYEIQGSNPMYYEILYRPTLTTPSWTAVDATYSGMEYDVSAAAVSGGIVVDSGYFATGRNTAGDDAGLLDRLIMAQGRAGTSDILTLAAVRTTASDSATYSTFKWKEIR